MKLYEGIRNKLYYVSVKLENMIDDFYIYDIKNYYTQNFDMVEKLETDIARIKELVFCAIDIKESDWSLIKKYVALADEFKIRKAI